MNSFKTFKNILKHYVSDQNILQLQKQWNSKDRVYHSLNHLNDVITAIQKNIWFDELNIGEKHALLLAAFYHDAIINPRRSDNEDKSIEYFKKHYIGKSQGIKDAVCELIETTKYRFRPINKLKKIFWEADNDKFKNGYDNLLKYEKQIRQEYLFVPEKEYKENRIKFLKTNIGLFGTSADNNIKKIIEWVEKNY